MAEVRWMEWIFLFEGYRCFLIQLVWSLPPRLLRQSPEETVAKMRETPVLPLRRATHSHYQMPEEGLLRQSPEETVAKMRETPVLPLRHATHSHYQMTEEGLLQQSAEQPDPSQGGLLARPARGTPKNES